MKFLFCNDDLNPKAVDSCYEKEAEAVASLGMNYGLIDFNSIRQGDVNEAVRFVSKSHDIEETIYRGWMLTPKEYGLLYDGLLGLNIKLINSPEEYQHCHWLPKSYSIIEKMTPRTVSFPMTGDPDYSDIMDALKPFGASPVIIKDYVKSQKHDWFDACFIPDASDESHVKRVTDRFIELQDEDLQGGLVFREFLELEPLGTHPKSGMPLTLEYRLFILDGSVVVDFPYWDAAYSAERPPLEKFSSICQDVKSNFFSCDIAKTTTGDWLIVELGDGQVAGIPELGDANLLYEKLANRLDNTTKP